MEPITVRCGIRIEPITVRCGLETNQVEAGGHVMQDLNESRSHMNKGILRIWKYG